MIAGPSTDERSSNFKSNARLSDIETVIHQRRSLVTEAKILVTSSRQYAEKHSRPKQVSRLDKVLALLGELD